MWHHVVHAWKLFDPAGKLIVVAPQSVEEQITKSDGTWVDQITHFKGLVEDQDRRDPEEPDDRSGSQRPTDWSNSATAGRTPSNSSPWWPRRCARITPCR